MKRPPSSNAGCSLPTSRRSTVWALVAVITVFGLSRVGYYVAGVRFDTSPLPWFWQFVDPALLKANLGQSLWYLHSQPPAFNFFLGVVLGLFPGHETAIFTVCYLLLGLAFVVALFMLMRGLGVPDVLSAVAASAYVVSPTVALYENWLFYTYPLTVLLLFASLFWHRFVSRGRFLDVFLAFACSAALALTWSLFHIAWLLGLVLALLLLRRQDWRRVLAAAAVPVLLVVLWYGKNLVQVGEFTSSTWFGMNFSRMTNNALDKPERQTLYDSGAISFVSFIQPFSSPEKYHSVVPKPAPTGIPVLDQETKSSGAPNFNSTLFIAVSRMYGRDARTILAARPAAYVKSLAESYLIYFLPTSAYLFLDPNARRINTLDRCASIAFNGQFGFYPDRSPRSDRPPYYSREALFHPGWFLVIAYALVLVLGFVGLTRRSPFIPHRSSLFFLWFNVIWVTFAANAVEVVENNRFRFAVDPLVLVFMIVVVFASLARHVAARRRG